MKSISRRSVLTGGAAALGAGMSGCASTLARLTGSRGDFPRPKFVQSNGIRMAVYQEGKGLPVVFSHGFPELAYSWRHQLPALAEAGYHAIAPDQRGYGATDRPEAIELSDIHHLTGDLVGLLDSMKIERAVFCGHDWGGMVVWSMGLLHPDRVAGIIGVNTPFFPRGPMPPIDMLRRVAGEDNYMVFFQKPGVADAALAKDVRKTFTMFMRRGGLMNAKEFAKLPPNSPERRFELIKMLQADQFPGELILNPHELDHYVQTYEKTGFTGGINWYRNMNRNWETTAKVEQKIKVPSLMISAEDDVVLSPAMTAGMEKYVPDLEKHVIAGCGHWTQQEKPEELNRLIIDWLGRRFPKGKTA